MSGVNKAILVGNLGKDPEVRYLDSGVSVARFTLATSETFKDRNTGERRTITEWHNIVLWRGLAEIAEKYLRKGSQVYIEGKIKTSQYQDKEGQTRYITEIQGNNMTLLGKASDNSNPVNQAAAQTTPPPTAQTLAKTPPQQPAEDDTDDDLPF